MALTELHLHLLLPEYERTMRGHRECNQFHVASVQEVAYLQPYLVFLLETYQLVFLCLGLLFECCGYLQLDTLIRSSGSKDLNMLRLRLTGSPYVSARHYF